MMILGLGLSAGSSAQHLCRHTKRSYSLLLSSTNRYCFVYLQLRETSEDGLMVCHH